MGGKASLIVVLGLSMVFGTIALNLNERGLESDANFVDHYCEHRAHDIAVSGANMAASRIYFDPLWTDGFSNVDLFGGELDVTVTDLPQKRKSLEAVGTFFNHSSTVRVILQPSSFAKFAFYVNLLPGNLYFVTKDTLWGPFHTQQKINVAGSPVFYGKVTNKLGIKKNPASSTPKFYGGYQSGVDIPLPADVNPFRDAAMTGGKYWANTDVSLEFHNNGNVTYTVKGKSPVTMALTDLAPNGTILVEKGDLRVKGTVKGKVTIGAIGSSGLGHGNVYLDDDIVYSKNPLHEPSTDMLGIIAENNFIITDNVPNKSDINIHASLFSLKGGLGAENYQHIGPCGSINLVGGLIEHQDQATGVFNSSTGKVTSGYQSRWRYDERLMVGSPPYFPTTGLYEILSWLE